MTDEHYTKTFCPECGPNIAIDEDGLCATCGATAVGEGVEKIMVSLDTKEKSLCRIKTAFDKFIEKSYNPLSNNTMDLVNEISTALLPVNYCWFEGETKRLEKWINDLHSGMWINCVYCGHRYGPKESTPVSMADVLKEHIEICPKHPMSKLKSQLTVYQKIIKYAQHSQGSEGHQCCDLLAKGFGFEKKCTCGLSDILANIGEMK